jgi:hypothetical protein
MTLDQLGHEEEKRARRFVTAQLVRFVKGSFSRVRGAIVGAEYVVLFPTVV